VDAVQWFAQDIFPIIQRAHPDAQFYIVGARPQQQVQALASRPGVHVTGTVDDVRPYIAHAAVSVAPLRIARGVQNKVLEAMAMARPVVVSPQALEGITAEPGQDVVLAAHGAQFASAVIALLTNRDDALGARARKKVVDLYGWTSNLARLDAALEPEAAVAAAAAKVGPAKPEIPEGTTEQGIPA
jgi:glycosyltransferase involved in cell wall biosynthesis